MEPPAVGSAHAVCGQPQCHKLLLREHTAGTERPYAPGIVAKASTGNASAPSASRGVTQTVQLAAWLKRTSASFATAQTTTSLCWYTGPVSLSVPK